MGKMDNYTNVILEDINAKFDFLVEIIVPMKKHVDEIPKIKEDISEIKADLKTIKLALTDTNKQVNNHETRITRLEAKTT